MDAPGKVPASINCHACGVVIDLTGRAGFTRVECPQCGVPSVVPLHFGNFLLISSLGVGGMGTVYKAMDLSLNRYVALKILRKKLSADPEFTQKFSTEARAAATVNHPNIAQVYSFGEHEGQYYLAMELLERGSLDDRITQQTKLPEKDVLDIGTKIASGLRAASQRGLLHRDVKPGNILFSTENVPKIVDFGLARIHVPSAESGTMPQRPGMEPLWGTPYYISPEMLRGQPEDIRSDIYSLGATLFHALAGRPPFEAATAGEVVTKHATQPALSLKTFAPTTHDYTAHVIARMLAKNPAERYESYDELIRELTEAMAQVKAAESAKAIVVPTGERFPLASVVGTAAAVLVCAAVAWFVWAKILRPPSAKATANSTTAQAGAAGANGAAAAAADEVDFSEDAEWVKAWNAATLHMTLGRYTEALLTFDNARQLLGPGRPKHRQWVSFFQGLTLLAADRSRESTNIFLRAIDPLAGTKVPETITTGNFSTPLAYAIVGTLAVADLEAAIPRMPPWAAALTDFSLGLKFQDEGKFDKAAESLRRYHATPVDEDQRWAFNMQSLAEKLARQCELAGRTVAEIDTLQKQGKYASALEKVRAGAGAATFAGLKNVLAARETQLTQLLDQQRDQIETAAQQAELERREQLERDLARLEQDRRALRTAEVELSALWNKYDFRGVRAKYDNLAQATQTTEGKRQLDLRTATARLLVEFKSELANDFTRRPYERGDLKTRDLTELTGRLARATEDHLVFNTPYGEILTDWGDLTPATLIKLAEHYIAVNAPATRGESLGRRYLRLAVFCKQYGAERAANSYAKQAFETAPALRSEVEQIFPKLSS